MSCRDVTLSGVAACWSGRRNESVSPKLSSFCQDSFRVYLRQLVSCEPYEIHGSSNTGIQPSFQFHFKIETKLGCKRNSDVQIHSDTAASVVN